MTPSELSERWPDAAVLFDRDIAPQGWEPRFRELDDALWADDIECAARVAVCGMRACRCVMWTGAAWISRSEAERPDRILAYREVVAERAARTVHGVRFVRADGSEERHSVVLGEGGRWPEIWQVRERPEPRPLFMDVDGAAGNTVVYRARTYRRREWRDARSGDRWFEYAEADSSRSSD